MNPDEQLAYLRRTASTSILIKLSWFHFSFFGISYFTMPVVTNTCYPL